jgi:hypothetical protein
MAWSIWTSSWLGSLVFGVRFAAPLVFGARTVSFFFLPFSSASLTSPSLAFSMSFSVSVEW